MTTVKNILKAKGNRIYAVPPTATVLESLKLMADKGIGALLVMDGDFLVGIFSERDYARRGILQGRQQDAPVQDMMTPMVYYVRPEQSIQDCMALMSARHIRHLPVIENNRVVGVISIGDVVKAIIEDQQHTISGLENYIMGGEHAQ